MPTRDSQLNVRLTEDRKSEWDDFVEETDGIDGVSELIRKAVTAYIASGGDPTAVSATTGGGSGSVPDDVSTRLSSIEDTLSEVSTTVGRVDESVGAIEGEVLGGEGLLTDWLTRAIPPAKPESEEWHELRERYEGKPYGEKVVWSGTVEDIAEVRDNDPSLVKQSLNQWHERKNSIIETDVVDGERRYWGNADNMEVPSQ